MSVPRIQAPPLTLPGIRHGFFTREGGVSTGIYESLNGGIGSRDDRALVLENRARACATLGIAADRLATPYQVHGTDAVAATDVWAPGEGPKADAVVTTVPGLALGVSHADCGPILLADAESGVVAAAHSGWRGALAGVAESVVARMVTECARRDHIVAVLGPTISQANYEVGAEVRDAFVSANPADAALFVASPREDHFLFDLPAAILGRLKGVGVVASSLGLCTYADEQRFYSYRRATHRGEGDYGRLLSIIVLSA